MKAAAPARPPTRQNSVGWALPALLLLALIVRLFFISNEGFKTDVYTFEAWAMALAEKGFAKFYGSAGFADYPPGYFYVLAVVGQLWETFFKGSDGGH